MSDDWDLNAVVRSCNFTAPIITTQTHTLNHIAATSSSQPKTYAFGNDDVAFKELQQQFFFYKPPPQHFSSPASSSSSSLTVAADALSDLGGARTMLSFSDQQSVVAKPAARAVPRRVVNAVRPEHLIYRPQIKRKNLKKVVRTMTKESLYADVWSWRKYGQKPIKGSPHPRNYYRCSSWRGCPARKQVERSQKNPELYVVTFSGEHHHSRSSSDEDHPHYPTATSSLPLPIVSVPEIKTEEEEEEDHLFANLDEVDLFDGFFFD